MWKTNETYDTYLVKDISCWKMQENVKKITNFNFGQNYTKTDNVALCSVDFDSTQYGNTGCGVFKRGVQN